MTEIIRACAFVTGINTAGMRQLREELQHTVALNSGTSWDNYTPMQYTKHYAKQKRVSRSELSTQARDPLKAEPVILPRTHQRTDKTGTRYQGDPSGGEIELF